jgi:predicted nucleic acid-binding protein
MNVVADASVLVAELIRARGRALVEDPRLRVVITEEQWSETQYELDRRLRLFVERDLVTSDEIVFIRQKIQAVIDNNAIEVIPRQIYDHLEAIARRRIPRDPDDCQRDCWPIALDAGILTNDNDFLGCGCATWTFETLRDELVYGDSVR